MSYRGVPWASPMVLPRWGGLSDSVEWERGLAVV